MSAAREEIAWTLVPQRRSNRTIGSRDSTRGRGIWIEFDRELSDDEKVGNETLRLFFLDRAGRAVESLLSEMRNRERCEFDGGCLIARGSSVGKNRESWGSSRRANAIGHRALKWLAHESNRAA